MVDVFSSHGRCFNVEADRFVLFPRLFFVYCLLKHVALKQLSFPSGMFY